MLLIINHQSKKFGIPIQTLEELVDLELRGKTSGVAVALNNQVVPKQAWADTPLAEHDSILIITATQGG